MATENVKYLDSTIMQRLVTDMKTKLNEKIDKSEHIYKPGGSYPFANLPAPSASNVGLVYNVTDRFTTTAAFIEGAGIEVEEGTDVAVVMTSVDPPAYAYNLFGMSEPTDEMSQEEYEEMWKDPGVLTLSEDAVSLAGLEKTKRISVETTEPLSLGSISCESSDTDVATVYMYDLSSFIITSKGEGEAVITVNRIATPNNRAVSKELRVTVTNSAVLTIVNGLTYDSDHSQDSVANISYVDKNSNNQSLTLSSDNPVSPSPIEVRIGSPVTLTSHLGNSTAFLFTRTNGSASYILGRNKTSCTFNMSDEAAGFKVTYTSSYSGGLNLREATGAALSWTASNFTTA